ncbi:MAG: FecR domain-containing protein [Candidatus Marinimicrobia bacterium]|nr:FecR domain-containing protein [Candidatus Neomarinimicrobiota bacterium]
MVKASIKLLGLLAILSVGFSADKLAVTTKKQGQVDLTRAETEKKSELKKGALLYNQDRINTGKDGSALILFLDDKSQLKLKNGTEIIISGSRGSSGISKRISMNQGVLKASIATQRRGEFIITTPTSVASVKGTEFWIISIPDSGDVIISNSGTIELVNTVTGEVITVPAGVIVESTADGEMNILETIKISGDATSELSGDQFSLQNIQLIEGDVDPSSISGSVTVTDNTIFEGGNIIAGAQVTTRGAFDSQTGNTIATLVEVAMPLQIEAVVTSAVSAGQFGIGEVSVVQGEAQTPPGIVGITDNTITEGDEIEIGATVTVTGYHNEETGVLNATNIVVTAVAQVTVVTISGTALSGIVNNQFSVSEISVIEGDLEPADLSGAIITSSSTEFTGATVDSGLSVVVTGAYDDSSQAVLAMSVVAMQIEGGQIVIIVSGSAQSAVSNNQFTISDIEVIEGEVSATDLSGNIIITDSTQTQSDRPILIGINVMVYGVYNETNQDIIASVIEPCPQEEGVIITATVQTIVDDNNFSIIDVAVVEGDIDITNLTGVITGSDIQVSGECELIPDARVRIEGFPCGQYIVASLIIVENIVVEGTVSTVFSNNQFEISDITVILGDVDEANLTGIVKTTTETDFDQSNLVVGTEVVVESCNLEQGKGNIIATRITAEEAVERELIFELENAQGDKKEIIITF